MKPKILIFSPQDQQAVKDFIIGVWKEFGYFYDAKYDYDLDDPYAYYIKTGGMFYVLKDGDRIIGTQGVTKKDNDTAELRRLYLDKNYRGKGLGSLLFDKALDYCQEKGYKKIIFQTDKIFTKAHKLYERRGFKIVREDEDEYYMEKIIRK